MTTFEGKSGIKATIIADSISEEGNRLTTFEVEYPRIIHAEVMTHRMLSRNAASSRAIPFEKMKTQLTGKPVRFGANVSGMQDTGVDFDSPVCFLRSDDNNYSIGADRAWGIAKADAMRWSQAFYDAGYHKQVFNRLTEPFQMIKVLITATEWANFFWLRNDNAADPTLHELARVMKEAYHSSTPKVLQTGEWHLPFVQKLEDNRYGFLKDRGDMTYIIGPFYREDGTFQMECLTTDEAIKVSAARCAAVSFRNTDYTLEKSLQVYYRLVGDERKHASAFEHQATPFWTDGIDIIPSCADTWPKGVTHMDKDYNLWSGNFKGFIQHRKLIAGENYTGGV